MDARTRNAIAARDRAVTRVGRLTWQISTFAVAGAAVLGAGFAHLLPTHLPHLNLGGSSDSSSSNNDSTNNGGGLQGPAAAPGQGDGNSSHVRSGGS